MRFLPSLVSLIVTTVVLKAVGCMTVHLPKVIYGPVFVVVWQMAVLFFPPVALYHALLLAYACVIGYLPGMHSRSMNRGWFRSKWGGGDVHHTWLYVDSLH